MILYRMAKKRRADDLSGEGAEKAGGRWNNKGYPAIYLANNRSLAILETIVHCQYIRDLYNRYILSIEVPEDLIDIFDRKKLPENWNSTPYNNFTIIEGTRWLQSFNNLTLKMPSAVVPEEFIFMVNPRHPEAKRVKIIKKEIFTPDNRLVLGK